MQKIKQITKYIKTHKLVSLLVAILLLLIANFAYNKYLDWDNAQMIKGLSRDFPVLVEQVESATGLDLEIKSNCQQTQEKFSQGVSTCEYLVVENPVNEKHMDSYRRAINSQDTIKPGDTVDHNPDARWFTYRGKNACSIEVHEYIYISCITAVRDANKPRLHELLNN